ncbi:tripartite tricarboxylate transporter TctB family protein [Halomonas sp. TRM85114]|uniref:tripartite tricarboxylate transporter TctB family protein n=1 Tax=Halomonas jincaotanensis TaxID=2810616 RepID=UPI001BD59B38|nr:tripartite tricarboxylate transporter TctB family protein [Halomonas jincaotanensis]MBS9402352.1 tripartite tricarboxylate transporter TctB family protein [Halomonas jincaotanensis]
MRDFLIGLTFIIAGCITIYVAQQFPTIQSLQYGPSLFPSLVGGGFCIGGLVLALNNYRNSKDSLQRIKLEKNKAYDWKSLLYSLLPAILIIFYILSIDYLGSLLTMSIMMFILMKVRKTSTISAISISAIMSFTIYYAFSQYLLVPLPQGDLFGEVKQWML